MFSLLYDTVSLKPILPYWKFNNFDMNAWSNTEYRNELHFAIERTLICCLRLFESHKKITCQQRTVCSEMERNSNQPLQKQNQLYSYAVA